LVCDKVLLVWGSKEKDLSEAFGLPASLELTILDPRVLKEGNIPLLKEGTTELEGTG